MAFNPLTTVLLLQGVPLDNTYKDTLTFGNLEAQEAFFKTKVMPGIPALTNLTYQREERYIAVNIVKDKLVNCNYLMYQNENYGAKWFYCFVTRTEYKNENTTWVYFDVDYFMTYAFDYTVKQCFVEREHVSDDSVGANLIDEGLALGDYVCNNSSDYYFGGWWIVAGLTVDPDPPHGVVSGRFYGGVFSGVRYYCYQSGSSFGAMLDTLESSGKLEGAVTQVFMLPKTIVSGGQGDGEELVLNPSSAQTWAVTGVGDTSLNGYSPRNKKLLTYPYRFFNVSNQSGQEATLRYEFFDRPIMMIYGSIVPNGKIFCYPAGYKGVSDNIDEGISIGNYPTCSWNTNVYANWAAQQGPMNAMALSSSVLTQLPNVMSGNPASAAAGITSLGKSVVDIAVNDMKEGVRHSFSPAQARGQMSGESTAIAKGIYGFIGKSMSITKDYAQSIDNFFTMFGYKVNKVKVPNIKTRSSFNYVKTVDAKITGNCPQPAIDTIKSAFNSGVTFWHGDFVGDYSRGN